MAQQIGRNPSLYPIDVSNDPQYFGEYEGYIYDPWAHYYIPDRNMQTEYAQSQGLVDKPPEEKSLMEQAMPYAVGIGMTETARYLGQHEIGPLIGDTWKKGIRPLIGEARDYIVDAGKQGYRAGYDYLSDGYDSVKGLLNAGQPAPPAPAAPPSTGGYGTGGGGAGGLIDAGQTTAPMSPVSGPAVSGASPNAGGLVAAGEPTTASSLNNVTATTQANLPGNMTYSAGELAAQDMAMGGTGAETATLESQANYGANATTPPAQAPSPVMQGLGYIAAAYAAYKGGETLYNLHANRTQGHGRDTAQGAAGGAAVGAAVGTATPLGPGLGTVIGAVIGGVYGAVKSWSSGDKKGKHYLAREAMRKNLGEAGMFKKGMGEHTSHWQVELADGTYFDIDRDGRSHWHDPQTGEKKVNPTTGKEYLAYEMVPHDDNPLWSQQGVSLIALSAIMTGGQDKYDETGALAGMLMNAANSQGPDAVSGNIRKMFDTALGADNPAAAQDKAIQIINALKDEGKLDSWEQIVMHQSINAAYNPELYEEANQAQFQGIDGVQEDMRDMYLEHLANDSNAAMAEEAYQQDKVAAGGERTWDPPVEGIEEEEKKEDEGAPVDNI